MCVAQRESFLCYTSEMLGFFFFSLHTRCQPIDVDVAKDVFPIAFGSYTNIYKNIYMSMARGEVDKASVNTGNVLLYLGSDVPFSGNNFALLLSISECPYHIRIS